MYLSVTNGKVVGPDRKLIWFWTNNLRMEGNIIKYSVSHNLFFQSIVLTTSVGGNIAMIQSNYVI